MRRAITLLLLLASNSASAAEVSATLIEGKLGARVNTISYPATLPKELNSGLTNRLYARVSLMDASETLGQRTIEIAIRYDLWDQVFLVVSTMDGAVVDSRTLPGVAEVNGLLAALPLPKLFDVAPLPATRDLVLRIELLLNPIGREKMRMIRKWVAQNNTPEAGPSQGISMSNAIFNRILDQYADGSDVAAAWRADVASAPFRIDTLPHEGR